MTTTSACRGPDPGACQRFDGRHDATETLYRSPEGWYMRHRRGVIVDGGRRTHVWECVTDGMGVAWLVRNGYDIEKKEAVDVDA